jgi:diguanylate cyclase (GGDEF)-like protein
MSQVADAALRARASQHQAVAELAQRALAGADLAALFAEAATTVATLTGADAAAVRAAFDPLLGGGRPESTSQPLERLLPGDESGFAEAVAGVLAVAVAAEGAREAARRQSLHDPLTGLPNRALGADRLARALTRVAGGAVAVLVVDIDDFKLLNDTHGHAAGDEVLVELGRRLADAVAPAGTVARMAADTFTVIYEAVGVDEVDDAADTVHRCFDEPFSVAGTDVYASASVGIASATAPASPDALLHDADMALRAAKQSGRGRRERFREDMRLEAIEHLEMRNAMRRALEREEFKVWYQPEIAMDGDHVVAFEALVRWEHPQLGVVAPAAFIPLAEESGLIVPLGEWVIAQACAQLRAWRDAGLAPDGLAVAVNLSTRQVAHQDLAGVVTAALARHEIEPSSLWLEINESTLMTDVEEAHRGLERLHDLGVLIGVDDFGTGYSSLSYLRRFPVDFLKVDRSFVAGLGRGSDDEAIVAAVVAMARNLGLTAVAEGVETAEQRAVLARLGCDMAQGYLWSPPTPAPDATAWLEARLTEEHGRPARPAARAAPLRGKRRARRPGPAIAGRADAASVAADVTRALLRVGTGEEAVGVLIAAVGRLGGQVMPARLRDPRGLPLDLSLGFGEPLQPVAELGAPARERLEQVVPQLLDDARLAVDRLAALDRTGDSESDPLTGLLSRRAVGRALGRLGAGSVLALIDVDGMGELRQRDPAAADDVLRSLSRLLRERLSGADKGGRFADDQLLLLLPGRTVEDAVASLERTRRLWRRVRPGPLTLSAAVGAVADRGPQFSLVAVDQALGRARDAGGDRIEPIVTAP